jgi:hypothetical protein
MVTALTHPRTEEALRARLRGPSPVDGDARPDPAALV